jgi:hypothetical protein
LTQPDALFIFAGIIVVGALITAIDLVPQYNTVPADQAIAVATARREGPHCTFETIEDVAYTTQVNFKAIYIVVSTDLTTFVPSRIL